MIFHQVFFKSSDGNTRSDEVCAFDDDADQRAVGRAVVKTWYSTGEQFVSDVTGNMTEETARKVTGRWHKAGK